MAPARLSNMIGLFAAAAVGLVSLLPGAASAEPVVIAKRTIYPGQKLAREFLAIYETDGRVISNEAYAKTFAEVEGKVAQRTVLPNRLVLLSSVRTADLVEAGEAVTVAYRAGGLEISMRAMAMNAGGMGDTVMLRNPETGRQFAGKVRANGDVEVTDE